MKRFAVLLPGILILASCGNDTTQLKDTPPDIMMYTIKSAAIEYEYSGDASGYKKQTFTNYGMYQREEDNFSIQAGDLKNSVHMLTIRNDTTIYTIDLAKNEGTQGPWDLESLRLMTADFTKEQKQNINGELLLRMGARLDGKMTILGKECDVYTMMGTMKVAMWNGIVLRSELNMGMHNMILTAKTIETDIRPDAELFQPPKDIPIAPEPSGTAMPKNPSATAPSTVH